MVAVPVIEIVAKNLVRPLAQGRFPGHPVALFVADDQVGGSFPPAAAVDFGAVINLVDQRAAVAGVAQGQQLLGQLAFECLSLFGTEDTLGLAVAQIEIDAVETKTVSPGVRPVYFLQRLVGLAGQITFLVQPGVEVEDALEGGKAVVGEHPDGGPGIHILQHPPQ